ncbi:uncharacterized protein LOC129822624 isoform X1 [Salvelinus fontinalis]|uniref:uncharacterized protein LOC129822624 isoform X1 n=1 Tax=Salvelinus fontinalis TaxID=8038 RepID=UPI00248678C0|nr:uncharacterized protein LOC129822624 isoform X1 [Salvelinus fontinalis]
MLILAHLPLLLLLGNQDSVTCIDLEKQHEVIYAAVGEPLVLNCIYNCSSGFVRGHWIKLPDCPHCPRPRETKNVTKSGDLCTLPLYFPHLSTEDFRYNYTCFSEDHESKHLSHKIEVLVSLQAQGRRSAPATTVNTDVSVTALSNHEDSIIDHEEFTVVKVLATVTVIVAAVLAAVAVYLCMSRNRYCKGKPAVIGTGYVFFHTMWHVCEGILTHFSLAIIMWTSYVEFVHWSFISTTSREGSSVGRPTTGACLTNCERVALRITPADCQSDHEVPYADIMITMRGASTPELTQIAYLAPGDHRERWREEARPEARSHLQASRSADRLHVQPREVSRKMSTNSEYAVITYS